MRAACSSTAWLRACVGPPAHRSPTPGTFEMEIEVEATLAMSDEAIGRQVRALLLEDE